MRKKSQVSMEYMMIVGFSLLLIIPALLLFNEEKRDIKDSVTISQSDEIIRKLIDTSEKVHYLGEPSKITIKVFMPSNIKSISITNKSILFMLDIDNKDFPVYGYSTINISGNLSTGPGIRYISIESHGSYVDIYQV